MKKVLAVVEMTDEQIVADPKQLTKVTVVNHFPSINATTFLVNWNEGIIARKMWDNFIGGLFTILTENQLLDENGFHFDDYSFGDICKYIIAHKKDLPKPLYDATQTAMGMALMQSIIYVARTVKSKKEIKIDFPKTQAHFMPMMESIYVMALKDPERASVLQPVINRLIKAA